MGTVNFMDRPNCRPRSSVLHCSASPVWRRRKSLLAGYWPRRAHAREQLQDHMRFEVDLTSSCLSCMPVIHRR